MPESHSPNLLPVHASHAASNPIVERILDQRFPWKVIYDALGAIPQTREMSVNDVATSYYARVQAERERLLLRTESELRALVAQLDAQRVADEAVRLAEKRKKEAAKAAEKEASKFYNLKAADADFSFWSKLEFWTFDESIALVLGKEPKAVTWTAIQRELDPLGAFFVNHSEPSSFVRQYARIREIALRAQVMSGDRLRPARVLLWAGQNEIVEPPAELVALVTKRLIGQQELAAAVGAATKDKVSLTLSNVEPGTQPIRWTPERTAELAKFKCEHGTKAAAAHFEISGARVRQLVPTKTKAAPKAPGVSKWFPSSPI